MDRAAAPCTEAAAALLERAYRLALVLETAGACHPKTPPTPGDPPACGFAHTVLAAELVTLLDEARAALLAPGVRPGPPSG